VLRQLPSARYPFNDLKNKKRHRAFYQRYKEVYNQVRRPQPTYSEVEAAQPAPTGAAL
jgi:hypothetical protein